MDKLVINWISFTQVRLQLRFAFRVLFVAQATASRLGLSIKDVCGQGEGVCPVRTRGRVFRCGRPYVLLQKTSDVSNLRCVRTDKCRGTIFRNFVRTSFMKKKTSAKSKHKTSKIVAKYFLTAVLLRNGLSSPCWFSSYIGSDFCKVLSLRSDFHRHFLRLYFSKGVGL